MLEILMWEKMVEVTVGMFVIPFFGLMVVGLVIFARAKYLFAGVENPDLL